jgi:MFS family permease
VTDSSERILQGYGGRMLVGLSVAWAVLQGGRLLLSPLLPTIIDSLHITAATAGFALTALSLVYAATQYPSGRLSDSWSRATLIVPGLGLLVLAFLALWVATSYAGFVVALLLLGIGKGLFVIPSRALLADLFVERRGQALGIYTAGTDIGGLVASGLAVVALAAGAWRTPFLPVAGVLSLATVTYVGWNREPYRVESADLELRETARRLATTAQQRRTLVAFALFYFFVGGFINFFPTYLAEAKGLDPALASAVFALVFVAGFVSKPVAGGLSDRFPRQTISVGGFLLGATALVVILLVSWLPLLALAVVALAVGYKAQFPIADALLLDAAPEGNAGGDLGAARAFFLTVGALGPAYVGVTATAFGYPVAFGGLAGCLLVAAGVIARR